MLDKVRARIAGNRNARGQFIPKSNGKTEAAGLRQTFTLGRERIKLAGTSDVERAELELVQSHARVSMRNKLGMASALARTKYPLFEGVKICRTPAQRRAAKRLVAKANVAARSAYLRGRAA